MPIWALFYKKVLADGTLGISSADSFVAPVDYGDGCGGEVPPQSVAASGTEEESYFD